MGRRRHTNGRILQIYFRTGNHPLVAAALTAVAIVSAVCRTRSASRPSTITRISGSVPDARRTIRPLPFNAASASATDALTADAISSLNPLAAGALGGAGGGGAR